MIAQNLINLLSTFIPSQCPSCLNSSRRGHFCVFCAEQISHSMYHYTPRCQHCLIPMSSHQSYCHNCDEHHLHTQRIYAACDYIPPAKSLVLQFKNAQQTHLAAAFAELLYQQLLNKHQLPSKQSILIPIPSSERALYKRGFNPATIFAKSLQKKLQCQLDTTVLRRDLSLHAQKELSRENRFLHSANLYYCAYRLPQASIILVDDILTTGSTLDAACTAVLRAGATQVDAMVIARSPHYY